VTGIVELRHLERELENVDEFIRQNRLREPGQQASLPRISKLLQLLASDNGLQLLQASDRKQLSDFLESVEQDAPRIHISFAIEPSGSFSTKLTEWLRANIHPLALLDVGLQPTIAAGCVVRTSNKVFDFSLRHHFEKAETQLVDSLRQVAREALAAQAPHPAAPAGTETA
jgi:F0F1-type ATP synthase delta subunit